MLKDKRMLAMAGGTLACAFAIGFVMQNTGSHPFEKPSKQRHFSQVTPLPETEPPLEIEQITLTSSQPLEEVAPARHSLPVVPGTQDELEVSHPGCDAGMTAVPVSDAMIELQVTAPCLINERLTVHHSGLMFTAATDQQGMYSVLVPALAAKAVVIVDFTNGADLIAIAQVPELQAFDRVAVQWSGAAGFQMHAREFGAGYGEPGHVWSGSRDGAEGSVVRLGEDAGPNSLMAEVYSFPSGITRQNGEVTLSVETEVTDRNCGRDVSAQSLELRGGGSLRTRDLVLSVPDCGATGDFLVLNNLVEDLKIAAR